MKHKDDINTPKQRTPLQMQIERGYNKKHKDDIDTPKQRTPLQMQIKRGYNMKHKNDKSWETLTRN